MATVLLALVVADAHSYAPDRTPATKDAQTLVHHRHRARVLIAEAHSLERWRDPTPAKAAEKRAWQAHRQAIRHKPTRRQISVYRERMARRFERHRELMLSTRFDSPICNRALARSTLQLDDAEWSCADSLFHHESGWEETAHNLDSGAYGIPQALPPSKMGTDAQGSGWNAALAQIRWGAGYVRERYGSFCGAWSFWLANRWY